MLEKLAKKIKKKVIIEFKVDSKLIPKFFSSLLIAMDTLLKQVQSAQTKNRELREQIQTIQARNAQLHAQTVHFSKEYGGEFQKKNAAQTKIEILHKKNDDSKKDLEKHLQMLKSSKVHTTELREIGNALRSQILGEKENFLGFTISLLLETLPGIEVLRENCSPSKRLSRLQSMQTPEQPTGGGNGDTPHPTNEQTIVASDP